MKILFLNIIILILLLHNTKVSAQNHIPDSLKRRYYSENINLSINNSMLSDTVSTYKNLHPASMFTSCGHFIKDSLMNEASVIYFIALNQYRLYNATNPNYQASGDGALLGSLNYVLGESIHEHLNKNLTNFSKILMTSYDLYKSNKYFHFKHSSNDSIYNLQLESLKKNALDLSENPNNYISELEKSKLEFESMMNSLDEELENDSFEDFEDIQVEEQEEDTSAKVKPRSKPSSQQPECIVSYNTPEKNFMYYNIENSITAVAHGYYDTYIESPNAKVIPDPQNPLHYTIIPSDKKKCTITIYGVSESGKKAALGTYFYEVREK